MYEFELMFQDLVQQITILDPTVTIKKMPVSCAYSNSFFLDSRKIERLTQTMLKYVKDFRISTLESATGKLGFVTSNLNDDDINVEEILKRFSKFPLNDDVDFLNHMEQFTSLDEKMNNALKTPIILKKYFVQKMEIWGCDQEDHEHQLEANGLMNIEGDYYADLYCPSDNGPMFLDNIFVMNQFETTNMSSLFQKFLEPYAEVNEDQKIKDIPEKELNKLLDALACLIGNDPAIEILDVVKNFPVSMKMNWHSGSPYELPFS